MTWFLPLLFAACTHQPRPVSEMLANRPVPVERAVQQAWAVLEHSGSPQVQVCQVGTIVAPLGGYLVDFKGTWEHDGVVYSSVRVGIIDGSEPERRNPFALIAYSEEGWFPDDPDAPYFISDFEFLPDREAFMSSDCS